MLAPDKVRRAPRYALDLAAVLLLLFLAFALYQAVLGLFWHADDFYNLRFSRQHTPLQVLASPATWGELPFKMVTPLMFLSFQLDLALAGASPFAFYLHQLLAVGLCAVLLYALLRLWAAPLAAFLGGAFSSRRADRQPSGDSHGAALPGGDGAAPAIAAFVLALQRSREGRPHLGGPPLRCSTPPPAWRIAVPLALGLLLLPEGDWRKRLRAAIPHGVVLVLYLAYRRFLLGTWGGGYGWAVEGMAQADALP